MVLQIPSETFRIQKLKVGNRVIEDVVATIGNIEGSLLLGQSFLSKLNSWSINNQRHVLILQ
jgi:predicted aspartyl protease